MSDNVNASPVEVEGRNPKAADSEESLTVNSLEWDKSNEVRGALIYKKYHGGLTAEETAELDRLQRLNHEVIERAFPRPRLSSEELAVVKQALGLISETTE
jgi:hypothetical protein